MLLDTAIHISIHTWTSTETKRSVSKQRSFIRKMLNSKSRELWRERERERVRDVWKNRSLDEIHIIKLDSKIDF